MTTGRRKIGDFCWVNMLTPEPAKAREFFGKLLGWTYAEIPGVGHAVRVGDSDIGGLFELSGPNTPPGTPPHIGVMVKVKSADEIVERVTALGGRALPAFDVADRGRMAVCFDPAGAELDVWEPNQGHGMEVDGLLHGAPSWFETMTNDVPRVAQFYSALFGWKAEVVPMPGITYTVFALDGVHVSGAMAFTPEMGKPQPHWITYFTVSDADATAKLALELGGQVCVPPQDIPNIGRFCGITSPQGVTFFVLRYL